MLSTFVSVPRLDFLAFIHGFCVGSQDGILFLNFLLFSPSFSFSWLLFITTPSAYSQSLTSRQTLFFAGFVVVFVFPKALHGSFGFISTSSAVQACFRVTSCSPCCSCLISLSEILFMFVMLRLHVCTECCLIAIHDNSSFIALSESIFTASSVGHFLQVANSCLLLPSSMFRLNVAFSRSKSCIEINSVQSWRLAL